MERTPELLEVAEEELIPSKLDTHALMLVDSIYAALCRERLEGSYSNHQLASALGP